MAFHRLADKIITMDTIQKRTKILSSTRYSKRNQYKNFNVKFLCKYLQKFIDKIIPKTMSALSKEALT